jgi:EAL domain-containing protein (putative c-di-GMP-specific phosphodiesterase class I)
MARSLGRRTVAPGVRDRATLLGLRRLGIGYAQGPAVAEGRPAGDQQAARA